MTEFENINVSVWEKINRLEGFKLKATEITEEYQLKAEKKNLKAIGIIGDVIPKPKSVLVYILNLCLRRKTKAKETKNNGSDIFWHKGEGMTRRSHNINAVKDLILKGLSYQQIWNIAGEFFTFKKFDEYYRFALNKINAESESDSATDYMKRKEAEKRREIILHPTPTLGIMQHTWIF